MTKIINVLFCKENALSWRRVTMSIGLEIFAGFALWHDKIDATTWAYFAASIAGVYIGGDTGEKMMKAFKPQKRIE
tara:strand:+ start:217 stop:444 length:228 start_codon:yes stop_codon:yes gene_type:complete